MDATQHAGQRFRERGALIIDGVRHFQHVFHGDAAGDAHVFGVSAVVEKQIVTEIFLAAAARIATQTGGRVRGHDAHANAPAGVDALADGNDIAHQFMPKNGRRPNHASVVAALPHFEVRSVGERKADSKKHFVGSQRRHVDHFDAQVLAAIENRSGHFRWHRDARDSSFQFFDWLRFLIGRSHA